MLESVEHKVFDLRANVKAHKKMAEFLDEKVLALLPANNPETLRLYFETQNHLLINMLRCALIDHVSVYAFNYNWHDTLTDDLFIKKDELYRNIIAVKLNQRVKYGEMKFSLNVRNTSNEQMVVYAEHIQQKNKDPSLPQLFEARHPLTRLQPGKYIKIDNISIAIGRSEEESSQFKAIASIYYSPPEEKELDVLTIKKVMVGFKTYGNASVYSICHRGFTYITNNLKEYIEEFGKISEKKHSPDKLVIELLRENVYKVIFIDMLLCFTQMIGYQIYINNPKIKAVSTHHNFKNNRDSFIIIHDENAIDLVIVAMKKLHADIVEILKKIKTETE